MIPQKGGGKEGAGTLDREWGPVGQPPLLPLSAALSATVATSYFQFRRKLKLQYDKMNIKYLNNFYIDDIFKR